MQAPVYILNKNARREQGKKAQHANIQAAKAVADIVRTTLGPKSMLKMLLDPMGGIVLTNDGNAILREIDVQHPAAKSMIELARAQDEEVGDGTTSVIILAGEVLSAVEGFLDKEIHPTVIVNAYFRALEEIVKITNEVGVSILFHSAMIALKSRFLTFNFYRDQSTSKATRTSPRLSPVP
jgi:T-complex protein 1 subunit gamma